MNGMKKIMLAALLGLSLTACSTNFPVQKFSLTLNVSGVTTATVTVTDTTSQQQVFNGPVTGSATIPDLTENHVYSIAPQEVTGYTAPATQTLTLKKNDAVSLIYTVK